MPFGLKNSQVVFSYIVVQAFQNFIRKFLQVYLDDWTVYGLVIDHCDNLRLMFERCWQLRISLNIKKCVFVTPFGTLLGHIMCKEGLLLDPAKVVVNVGSGEPTSQSVVHRFLGHMGYYKKFIKGYAKIATPLEELLKHKISFH